VITIRIVARSVLIFGAYFIIGLQLAVVPGFVHWQLGYNPVIAGLAMSVQYVATLLSRPLVGRLSDTVGGKRATSYGLILCAAGGLLFSLSAWASASPSISLWVLLVARLILGTGESCVATGATVWAIGRVGSRHMAQVISWSGIASSGAVGLGAPAGMWIQSHLAVGSIGLVSASIMGAAYLWSLILGATPIPTGQEISFRKVFVRVLPHGLGLALGGVGFGTIASFITLYYASRHWSDPAFALTAYGIAFITSRLLFIDTIDQWGGYRVAIAALIIECAGLLILWLAPTASAALLGALVTGLGFSLVFPALGVETVRGFSARNQGAALGVYTAFIDLSLGIAGPMVGIVITAWGYPVAFLFASILAFASAVLSFALYQKHKLPVPSDAAAAHAACETSRCYEPL
jgi:MFS family permease